MNEEFKDQTLKEKQNMWKSFNEERTDFWWSCFYLLIESIIPGLAIWILVGNDFTISMSQNLPSPRLAFIFLILCGYLFYTCLTTWVFYRLKLHKADNFTYSITFTCIISAIVLIGFGLNNLTVFLIVKFIVVILVGVICLTAAVFFTNLARTNEIKAAEKFSSLYQAWKKGEVVSPRINKKMVKYDQKLEFLIQHEIEVEKIRKQVEKKVNAKLKIEEEEKNIKIINLSKKLDAKEAKKRAKDKKIKF